MAQDCGLRSHEIIRLIGPTHTYITCSDPPESRIKVWDAVACMYAEYGDVYITPEASSCATRELKDEIITSALILPETPRL